MYLKNDHITLRALEPEDLEHFYRWENDSSLWSVSSAVEPYSRYVIKQYLAEADKTIYEKNQLRFIIERNVDKAVLGAVDLFDFDSHHLRAAVGVLVDKNFQNQGVGTESVALLITYAFEFLNLKQLYANVPITNTVSKALFSKLQFSHTGTLKKWLRQGRDFVDVEILQLLQ
ncbi:MAG TPA: GNAT family protein [Paludibacteraceae bacterium]|jgi:diamine N-acetyltransferase|nr:GNAT family protein [Paludibacteraceae bacterium]HQB68904.1 GNAT family protein [Paludibacteraceae bacterium]